MTKRKLNNKIKKIRVGAKRKWFLHYRPMAQKLFFPILGIILLIGILNYERNERGVMVFENVKAASVFEETAIAGEAQPAPIKAAVSGTLAHTEASVAVPTGGTQVSSVSGSVIEAKIKKAFPGEEETAVAVAKCESQLDPMRIGDTDFHKPSVGLFQINQFYHPYSTKELQDADRNIAIAKNIKERWGNWGAWSCYKFKYYEKYL